MKERLDVTPGALGLILLCVAFGSMLSMPASGLVINHVGAARTVAVSATTLVAGLVVVAVGYYEGAAWVAAGLTLLGLGNGAWDVAMNVEAAQVEQRLGRTIMARFHAGFSVGTVIGAGLGAAAAALHVVVSVHLAVVAALVLVTVPVTVLRGFLPRAGEHAHHDSPRAVLAAWREPRTVLIGLFVLCLAFVEGTGNDWLSLSVVDGYGQASAVGAATLAIFLTAMTLGRWLGPGVLDRFGRVPVLRASALVALAGVVVVVYGHDYPVAVVGAALWGLGTALGFPTGISAAADDPRRASARVSVTSSIAYLAFLGGPPLVGFVADHVGTLRSLLVAGGVLLVATVLAAACRPLSATAASDSPAAPVPEQPSSPRPR